MSAAPRFLHLPAPSNHGVRTKYGGPATSISPGVAGCRTRRGRPSSIPRYAFPPAAHSASAPVVRASGAGDGVDAGGTAAVASSGGGADYRTAGEVKAALLRSLQGINRGIFGVQSQRRSEIEGLVDLLESRNPTPDPTDHLDQVGGCWKLLYSTVTILGSKRTKLGLRDFISLGEFFQKIDVVHVRYTSPSFFSLSLSQTHLARSVVVDEEPVQQDHSNKIFLSRLKKQMTRFLISNQSGQGKAINEIKFGVSGLKMLSGQLTIVASFTVASKTRVDIKFERSDISPEQLMNLFQQNYDLLLAIFNPEGWLDITYVDESIRMGRDDKGNIFILERTGEEKAS